MQPASKDQTQLCPIPRGGTGHIPLPARLQVGLSVGWMPWHFEVRFSLASHGCVTVEFRLHEAPAPPGPLRCGCSTAVAPHPRQERCCAQALCSKGGIFVQHLLKSLQGAVGIAEFSPKYRFSTPFWLECARNTHFGSPPCTPGGLWGVLSACSIAGGWICGSPGAGVSCLGSHLPPVLEGGKSREHFPSNNQ